MRSRCYLLVVVVFVAVIQEFAIAESPDNALPNADNRCRSLRCNTKAPVITDATDEERIKMPNFDKLRSFAKESSTIKNLKENPALTKTLSANPSLFKKVENSPQVAKVFASVQKDAAVMKRMKSLEKNPSVVKLRREVSKNPSAMTRENARKVGAAALNPKPFPKLDKTDGGEFGILLELVGVAIVLGVVGIGSVWKKLT